MISKSYESISRLLLFDIDGTLLHTSGNAVQALLAALESVYGKTPPSDGFLMDGKTELRIVHELLAMSRLARQDVESRLHEFWPSYAIELKKRILPATTVVYEGVRELIKALGQREDVLIALLTGNCEAAARVKLDAAGLGGAFSFGIFGQHHEDRQRLPRLALDEAERRFDIRLAGKAVVIVGDTPADILCAKPLGLRSIAVATGRYTADDLASFRPDYVFENLSDIVSILRAIFEPIVAGTQAGRTRKKATEFS